jgi:hypothetical protein
MRALIAGIADIARNRRDRDWDPLGIGRYKPFRILVEAQGVGQIARIAKIGSSPKLITARLLGYRFQRQLIRSK